MEKNLLLEKVVEKINLMFINNYNDVDSLKNVVNDYIKDLNFDYKYKYNDFCSELKENTVSFIYNIQYDDFELEDVTVFIYSIISDMIRNLITDSKMSKTKKSEILIKHNINYHQIIK